MLKGRKSMNETVNTTMATALNGPGKRPLGSRINMKGSWLGFVYTLAPIPPARTLCITHSLLASIKQYSGLVLVSGSRSKPKLCSLSRRSHACWLYDDLYALATSVDKRNHQSENNTRNTTGGHFDSILQQQQQWATGFHLIFLILSKTWQNTCLILSFWFWDVTSFINDFGYFITCCKGKIVNPTLLLSLQSCSA